MMKTEATKMASVKAGFEYASRMENQATSSNDNSPKINTHILGHF